LKSMTPSELFSIMLSGIATVIKLKLWFL
jgi:hypothetical protein